MQYIYMIYESHWVSVEMSSLYLACKTAVRTKMLLKASPFPLAWFYVLELIWFPTVQAIGLFIIITLGSTFDAG